MSVEGLLKIDISGKFRLEYGEAVVAAVEAPRQQELLAYLLLNRDTPISRQSLAFQFWPDASEKQARNNLRQLLFKLRSVLPDADRFLTVTNKTCQWNLLVPYQLDIAEFERLLEEADQARESGDKRRYVSKLIRAESLYKGPLLENCYSTWIESYRDALDGRYRSLLENLVGQMEAERDYSSAITYARKLLNCNEFQESAYQTLMRLYALVQDRPGIYTVYQQCVDTLRDELELEPSAETVRLYEQLMADGSNVEAASTPEPRHRTNESWPLVGRREEWELLLSVWKEVLAGGEKCFFISGEPGIGKSRLVQEFSRYVNRQGYVTAYAKSYEAAGTLSYGPVTEWLRSADIEPHLAELDSLWLIELVRLLPELLNEYPGLSHPGPITDGWQRIHFFEAITRAVLGSDKPRLLVIDDLQWCDGETLAWLDHLMHYKHPVRLLVAGMIRPVEGAANLPLQQLKSDLRRSGLLAERTLEPLNKTDTLTLIGEVAEEQLDEKAGRFIYRETEGNPLYIVECVREGVYSEAVENFPNSRSGTYISESRLSIPEKVTEVIASRFDQLSGSARELLNLAAAVGNECSFGILTRASNKDQSELIPILEELIHHCIIREKPGDVYDFTHDKLREVAYQKMSRTRRSWLHRNIAEALEEGNENRIRESASRIAYHYDRANLPGKAGFYYNMAAEAARDVYANRESLGFLKRAVELLEHIPGDIQRWRLEKSLYTNMAVVMIQLQGFGSSEVFEACERITELCSTLDERVPAPIQRVHAIAALVIGDASTSLSIGEQLWSRATTEGDSVIWTEAGYVLGAHHFWCGNFSESRRYFEEGLEKYDPDHELTHIRQFGQNPRVTCEIRLSLLYWVLDLPDKAEEMRASALEHADETRHPHSLDYVRSFCAWLYLLQGRYLETQKVLESIPASSASNFTFPYWHSFNKILRGWSLTRQGSLNTGITLMRNSLKETESVNTEFHKPHFYSLLAEAVARQEAFEEATALLKKAFNHIEETGQRWIESEVHRIYGEVLLKKDAALAETANRHFQKAVEISSQQCAEDFRKKAVESLQRSGHSS